MVYLPFVLHFFLNFSHTFSSSILLTQTIFHSHIHSQKTTGRGCKGDACSWPENWKRKTEASVCGQYLSLEINCLWSIPAVSYVVNYKFQRAKGRQPFWQPTVSFTNKITVLLYAYRTWGSFPFQYLLTPLSCK